jgi:hypothetical protein
MWRKTFGGLALVIAAMAASSAGAGSKDYRFEAATPEVSSSPTASIQVRLVHVPTGKPVADAILLPARLEMPMGTAAPMIVKAAAKGSGGNGIYEYVADLSMIGTWTLKVSVKAQGESDTITGNIPISVVTGDNHNSHH